MKNRKTYVLQIQEGALSKQDTAQLKKLLAAYINKTKLPPQIGESTTSTLSNCKDTDTECTCQWDD
jgi:hypothetical protein